MTRCIVGFTKPGVDVTYFLIKLVLGVRDFRDWQSTTMTYRFQDY